MDMKRKSTLKTVYLHQQSLILLTVEKWKWNSNSNSFLSPERYEWIRWKSSRQTSPCVVIADKKTLSKTSNKGVPNRQIKSHYYGILLSSVVSKYIVPFFMYPFLW